MSDVSETAIKAVGLRKTFYIGFLRKKVEALRGVDLEAGKNEILGFLGPNGAGKTTTIKVLMGIIYPDEGDAEILGKPLGDLETKSRIGFLPEQPYFHDYLTGAELLEFYGRLHGLSAGERKARSAELLGLVGMAEAKDRPLRKYSKGMLQRIGMAQALLADPELVVLDEPMSGLDPIGRKDMREIIFHLKELGKTIFFSSHVLPDVEQICDRVCIVNKGKVVEAGRLDEILKPDVDMVDLQFSGLDDQGRAAIQALDKANPGLKARVKGGLTLVSAPGWDAADLVEEKARQLGAKLVGLHPQRETLESYFLKGVDSEAAEQNKPENKQAATHEKGPEQAPGKEAEK